MARSQGCLAYPRVYSFLIFTPAIRVTLPLCLLPASKQLFLCIGWLLLAGSAACFRFRFRPQTYLRA